MSFFIGAIHLFLLLEVGHTCVCKQTINAFHSLLVVFAVCNSVKYGHWATLHILFMTIF